MLLTQVQQNLYHTNLHYLIEELSWDRISKQTNLEYFHTFHHQFGTKQTFGLLIEEAGFCHPIKRLN